MTATPESSRYTFYLSGADLNAYLILDNTVFGTLDNNKIRILNMAIKTFTTGEVLTAVTQNNMPFGVVDYKSGTTAQTAINTATDITGLSITWTAVADRVYMAQFNLNPYGSAGDSSNQLIVLDGTEVWQNRRNFTTLNVIDSTPGQYLFTTMLHFCLQLRFV
jgi:hypothetical protein